MNKTKREGAAHGKTGWDLGRIGKLTLVVLILVSSLFGMVGFTAVPTTDDGSTTAENPVVTTAPAAEPSAEPTPAPDVTTTPEPTVVPTAEPTAEPTPTVEPIATPEPTAEQTPTPDVEPTLETETEIPVTLHIIAAPDAEEECIPFTVPAGSSLDLLVNDSVLYSLTGSADMYSAEGETEPEQTETEQTETWEWYTLDTEGGKVPYDLSAPITAPLDVYAARGVAATAATAKTVMFYIAIDGEWVKLTTTATTTDTTSFPGGTTQRYYISYSDLVNVYKDYDSGIEDNTYSGELFFPHRDDNSPQKIWADVAPMKATDGTDDYWIPLGETGVNVQTYYVYYTPGNVTNNPSCFAGSKEFKDATLLADNSFYTIEFNGNGKVNDSELPSTQYVRSGGTMYIELPVLTDAKWVVLDKDGNALDKSSYALTVDEDGSTLQIKGITQPLTVAARGEELYIVYNAGIKCVKAGQFADSDQSIVQDGTVKGAAVYNASPVSKDGTMTVLATDSDRAEVKVNNNKPRTIFYTFKGWKLDDSDKLITPGAVFSYDQLRNYAVNNTVTFTAEWTPFEKNAGNYDLVATVNFYVCYDCEIAGKFDKGYTPPIGTKDFTNSVFATRVFGTSSATSNSSTDFNVISPPDGNTGNTPADVDGRIRTLKITGAEGLSLMEFPTDETVLKALRDGNEEVHVNKVEIDHKYLTSDHFTIRWYVFKYEHSDGYHIDGVLVAKAARLVVTKTFTGSVGVIEAVKKGSFCIDVLPADDTTGAEKYKLVLKAAGSMSLEEGETGYTSYDPKTDTYTWVLSGYPNMKYTVKESGDDIPNQLASDYSHTARYMVRNPNQQTVTPVSGWNSYDGTGVTVTVASYAKDILDSAVQTVALENMYVKTGTITIAKRDSVTGHGIAGVEFVLSMNDPPEGTTFQLYHKPGSSQYSSDNDDEYTETVTGNVVVTGGNGYTYLKLKGGHTYTLTEQIPLGYNGAASVTFAVDEVGRITNISETYIKDSAGKEIKLPSGAYWATLDDSKTVLSIDNLSHILTEVKVQCAWDGVRSDEEQPVTVQLWRGGAPMVGEEYTVELNDANKWSRTWGNLPLFVDGKLAEYSVRVTYIGDTAYDASNPDVKDGYEDYSITSSANRYKKGADGEYDHETGYWKDGNGEDVFADHVLIHRYIRPVFGKLTLRKVSDTADGIALKGVEFKLYSDADCMTVVDTATSGDDGDVAFSKELAAGTYYLKETKARPGYAIDTNTYKVTVHAGRAIVTTASGSATVVPTIVNETSQTLTINKVNQYDSPVPGATFTLTRDGDYDGGEERRNDSRICTSDNNGMSVLDELERGRYILRETAAPNGYKRLDTEFKFVVADGKIFVPENVHVPDGWVLTETQEGSYTLTVTNQVLYVFPTTGGVGIYAPIALGAALMCMSAVLIIKRKRETA